MYIYIFLIGYSLLAIPSWTYTLRVVNQIPVAEVVVISQQLTHVLGIRLPHEGRLMTKTKGDR